ncbi:MAG TPA: hypothetical protein ACQGQG_06010 [Xylella sp.]
MNTEHRFDIDSVTYAMPPWQLLKRAGAVVAGLGRARPPHAR